jgi:Ca-activated chloride channel family protein
MDEQLDGGRRAAVLADRIRGLPPEGGTGLYDTSLAAFQYVRERQSPGNINAVVLLTDGRNEDNGLDLPGLLDRLRTERGDRSVRLFTIAYGADADVGILKQIGETSGGAGYDSSDPTSIDQVFTAVVSNF